MLNVYFDGTNSGIDPGVELVVEGVIVSINVAGWNVGILVVVSVGWIVNTLVAISALGPKGVREGDGCWLGVTVGPITIGSTNGPVPVQAARNKKVKNRRK